MGSYTDPSVRIASASGSVTDRRHGFAELARDEDVHFIVGDWMSEYNMTQRGSSKVQTPLDCAYEPTFIESITPALDSLSRNHIKVAVNAGASDTRRLCQDLLAIIDSKGLDLNVAYVEGDEVLDVVQTAQQSGQIMRNLTTGGVLDHWEHEPLYAQCYLGCFGIVEAFKHGADIVLCGRVADASPTMAAAAYFHDWSREDYSRLAHAFVAGHLIECGEYLTGGNFSGFKQMKGRYRDIGFPIVEINRDGQIIATMQAGKDGMVSAETCKAQLLYEIQGPLYYNSDVVAVLDKVQIVDIGKNRVKITNIGHIRPPPTTKVGITAHGGYQAEVHYFLCGLDIAEKAAMIEAQIRHVLDASRYHTLSFRTHGSCPTDPTNQDSATTDFRIFAQSKDETALSPENFFRPCTDNIMQSYPGATFATDTRQALPKPYYEYFVTLIPQASDTHQAVIPHKGLTIPIPPPLDTEPFIHEQPSYDTTNPTDLGSFGPTTFAPLGYIVHARSGDKGSDANVGFFVRHADEWDWLRSILTVERIKTMLGRDYNGDKVFRFELPNIWAVHFLLKDHLDRGVSSTSSYDALGKNVAEYLRCKPVEIPNRFLERGRI